MSAVFDDDDELPPVIGERYRDVLDDLCRPVESRPARRIVGVPEARAGGHRNAKDEG